MTSDEQLEELLLKVQERISKLKSVLNDYIYMDSQSTQHICHIKRDKKTSQSDFCGVYTISAEVFGKGIEMWLRSQGELITIL